jgi:hypothetical protein
VILLEKKTIFKVSEKEGVVAKEISDVKKKSNSLHGDYREDPFRNLRTGQTPPITRSRA